jgi:protoporphyrinogen IX oxidase
MLVGILGSAYLWVKAAHLIFVIFWIAGLFMLPRFYIYQQPTIAGSDEDQLWIERARRLREIILTPSLLIVWLFGLALAFDTGAWGQAWFHAKLLLVILLSGYHGWAIAYGKKLAQGYRPDSDKHLRLLNEVPGIATVLIIILVIVRPF